MPIQLKNMARLAHGHTRTSRRPPQPEITLVLRGKFRIVQDGVCALPPGIVPVSQGSLTGDVWRDDDDDHTGECLYSSDLADFKRNAEVLLSGTCHVPGGRPVAECPVSFAVGPWSKILRVVGPRTWSEGLLGAKPAAPRPFTRMPLGYTNSFGGPGYAPNPVGKGLGTPDLPTIERPGEPVLSRSDRPEPAGFGPLSPTWPARRNKLGKGRHKLHAEKGSPFYSDDFDWSYFQAAPPDQQLRGYLRGDEEMVFHNLHPTHPVLRSRLPGIRARAFLKCKEQRFREVQMNLDTLHADLDEEVVFLTWRGLDAVKELDLLDVQTVLFASEELSAAPLPEQHYREALEAFERDPKRLDEVLSEDQRAEVERATAAAKAAQEAKAGGAAEDPLSAVLDGKLGLFDAKTREHLKSSLSALMAKTASHGVDLKDHIRRALDRTGAAARGPGAKPGGGMKSALGAVQQRMEALRAEGPAPGTAKGNELDAYEKLMKDPRLAEAGLVGPGGEPRPPEEPGPGRDLQGLDLSHQDLRGRDLTGANLSGAILANANLQNANLSGAVLKRAVLSEADLTGADLSNTDLTEALLVQARAAGANLRGATLTRTIFHQADLGGADLGGAKGESPIFSKARLTGANAEKVRFVKPVGTGADLEGANLSGADLSQGVFSRCNAKRVNLSGATLNRMSFLGSNLSEADLTDARGEQTAWLETDLTGADFSYAVLPSALWGQARAVRARFFGANLKQGNFYRTILDQADMSKANLFEANFTMATIVRTRFAEASLYGAKLMMVIGAENDFTKANLEKAVLEIKHARG